MKFIGIANTKTVKRTHTHTLIRYSPQISCIVYIIQGYTLPNGYDSVHACTMYVHMVYTIYVCPILNVGKEAKNENKEEEFFT